MATHEQPTQLLLIRPYFREWRKSAGLSQERLAKLMGITPPTVHKHETEQRVSVQFEYLEKFALAVGCNPWDPIAGPPGTLPQIDALVRKLNPDDQELILRIVKQFIPRVG